MLVFDVDISFMKLGVRSLKVLNQCCSFVLDFGYYLASEDISLFANMVLSGMPDEEKQQPNEADKDKNSNKTR